MKYFYFQMLKDKKIIIHKTDGKKTFIPFTGRSYRTNSSHGFLSLFSNFSLSILAAILSSVKQGKQTIYDFTFPPSTSLSAALQVKPARRLQEKSAARCPSLSLVCGWQAPSQTFKRVLKCKLKRGLFSFTSFAP